MCVITIRDDGTDIPESRCSECDMRFNICWSRNPVYESHQFCPFCGEEIESFVKDSDDAPEAQ